MFKQTNGPFQRGALAIAVACALASGVAAAADTDRIQELETKLNRSMELINKLSARLNEIESSRQLVPTPAAAAKAAPSAADAATTARIDQLEQSLLQVSESSAKKADLGLPLHGFIDVGYGRVGTEDPQNANKNRRSGFGLGNVDFYLTPQLSDRVRALVELNFEYNQAGDLSSDLERMQIAYAFSDAATLWAGRFHTPYGYWNTAFHHGAQLQTSILRPRMIAFEDQGGFMQAHTVGGLLSGSMPLRVGKFQYDFWVGNGAITTDDRTGGNGGLDFNRVRNTGGNMAGANLRYAFGGKLSGLTLGVHGYHDIATNLQGGLTGAEDSRTEINMLGGFGAYDADDWEIIGEYYHFNNKNLWVDNTLWTAGNPAGAHDSWAGFLQVGKTLHESWTPYVRAEKAVLDQNDNYFASISNYNAVQSGRSYQRNSIGLRYAIDQRSAVKLEISSTNELRPGVATGDYKTTDVRLQYAIRF